MKKHAIIVHGWGASPKDNWFPWLGEKLEENGFRVNIPDFPNTNYPKLDEWLAHFKKSVKVDKETILIGHSLGPVFILRFLEGLEEGRTVKVCFFVSGFAKSLGIPETENFFDEPFDWQKIKRACPKFFLINSDNDPYIPIEIGKDLAKKLGIELMIEKNGGHLNAPGGFLTYPRLLKLILNTIL